MATSKPFDGAERAMRRTLDQIFKLRGATIELKQKQTEIGKAGNKLFDRFQEQFKASLQIKKTRAAKKLKPATAEN